MPDIINMTITTPPAVNMTIATQVGAAQSITGFGIKGDKGDKGDTGDAGTTNYNELTNLPDLTLKADKSDTYTKIEVDTSLAGKAELVHVHAISDVTGLQTALDGKSATGHTHTATNVTDFDTEVSNNTDVAANTAARHTHANSAVLNATTASFTTADETKLTGIAAGAQVNTVTSVNTRTGAVTGLAEASDLTAHTSNTSNPHGVTKAQVGLGNVNDTSDADKPISTATQTALDGKFTQRTITGTADEITVTNGSGASGNPTLSLALTAAKVGALPIPDPGSFYPTDTITAALQLIGGRERYGTGSPEGVLTAPVGTEYLDTAGTCGAWRWLKVSGAGNTGWAVTYGDTGWRQMKADWNVSPRSSGDGFVERLLIRRVGNRITLACYLHGAFGDGKNHSVAAFLPVGFRNTSSLGVWPEVNRFRLTSSQTTYVDPILETGTAGNLRIITPSPTHEAYSEIAWVTDHQWPTSLPGVAA